MKNKYQKFYVKKKYLASGKDSVRAKIKELNHENKKISNYILETPIQILEDIGIQEDLKNHIEFIDFPGLDTTRAKTDNYTNNELFKIVNGFFFLNEQKNSAEHGADDVFKIIIKKLALKNSNVVNLKNCLILFTKNNKEEQKDFSKNDFIDNAFQNLIKNLKKELVMVEIEEIKRKLNKNTLNVAKLSNIDYYNYMEFIPKIISFKTYINYLIQTIKIENGDDLDSIFEDIDNVISKDYSNFQKKEEEDIKTLSEYNNYIEDFINILQQNNIIGDKFTLDLQKKKKIIEYSKIYMKIKNNLKNLTDYKNSFYEDFKEKFIELMKYSQISLNNIFSQYLREIYIKTDSIISIINENFLMDKEEFNKKYSIKEHRKYNNNIKNFYQNENKKKEDILLSLRNEILNEISSVFDVDYGGYGTVFKKNFDELQNKINNLIKNKYEEILTIYFEIEFYININIGELKSNKYNSNEFKVNNIKLEKKFKVDDMDFEIYNFIWNLFYDYTQDIKNLKRKYKISINKCLKDLQNYLNDKIDIIYYQGKDVIDLIFITAASDFENIKKNKHKYEEISNEIESIFNDHKI